MLKWYSLEFIITSFPFSHVGKSFIRFSTKLLQNKSYFQNSLISFSGSGVTVTAKHEFMLTINGTVTIGMRHNTKRHRLFAFCSRYGYVITWPVRDRKRDEI